MDAAWHPPVETVTTVRNTADGFRFDKNFTLGEELELGIEAGSRCFLDDSQDRPLSFRQRWISGGKAGESPRSYLPRFP